MPYMEKIIISGDYVEIEQYPVSANGKKLGRGGKENASSESQKKLNEKNARKKLTRLINTNFGKQDLFVMKSRTVTRYQKSSTRSPLRGLFAGGFIF